MGILTAVLDQWHMFRHDHPHLFSLLDEYLRKHSKSLLVRWLDLR